MVVLGLMSGTSLDGLDLALVRFLDGGKKYKLLSAYTHSYSQEWISLLRDARKLSKNELSSLHINFGDLLGQLAVVFLEGKEKPDLISSHGHTIFHQPNQGITLQIGDLDRISVTTGIKTVGDFRRLDVLKGGQGAPLVPVGDDLLFSEYDYCINLGGISNYSTLYENKRIAKDISPCNIVSNIFSSELGVEYDKNGEFGKRGNIKADLLQKLETWSYYTKGQSLGIEDIERGFIPMFNDFELSIEDKLRTFYEHIAKRIGNYLVGGESKKALFTGGGVKNLFLMNCIEKYSDCNIIVPSNEIIDFKEAIVFGLLGYLRINNKTNVLSSVTGASSDSCSGKVSSI
jgi:anhydro-N-acetylmuramic acid kinase